MDQSGVDGAKVSRAQGRLALALAAGSGVGLAHLLYVLVKSEPARVLDIMQNWGPVFAIAAFLIYVGDRRFGEMIQANRDGVVAMQSLADGVKQIAERDDQRARELDLTLSLLAKNSEEILGTVTRLSKEMHGLPCGECPGGELQ